MEIESANILDLEGVVGLWSLLVEDQKNYGASIVWEENAVLMQNIFSESIHQGNLIVARSSEIQGFVNFGIIREGMKHEYVMGGIYNLFVKEPKRNLGIGSKLLYSAEAILKSKGAKEITMEVLKTNLKASRFYKRHGYKPHRIEYKKIIKT
jgi:ribosomal protein S18 acetylase RimI-like enzyme